MSEQFLDCESYLKATAALADSGSWDSLGELIQQNVGQVGCSDPHGTTVLHILAAYPGSTSAMRHAIAAGANANRCDNSGCSPLGVAISADSLYGISSISNVEELLKAGASLEIEAQNGQPALHWAIYERKNTLVQKFLEAGADVNTKNSYGENALEFARSIRAAQALEIIERNLTR